MNFNSEDFHLEGIGQSPGCDPKTTKRNSGLFAFLKWFKPSTSRESIDTQNSSSCESLNSTNSNGTVASFSYVPPSAYNQKVSEKCIVPGPETDTYRARLKQRDKRREKDRNTTLRKKYNLFFQREAPKKEEENSKSLPLMTRGSMEEEKSHRRTNSDSSKTKKAGAYLHVKGKRKAPQPPKSNSSTMSLRRKKRTAPAPPPDSDVIANDCLKLDHGILKSTKETIPEDASARSSVILDTPVSPRPWYKRNTTKKDTTKHELPDLKSAALDLTSEEARLDKKKEDKRKSGMSFLTNISELDREASEIIKKEHEKNGDLQEMPQFMRPREEPKPEPEAWVSPKRRSAKDLIAKFNAITNVTKATVFGVSSSQKKEYFGKRTSMVDQSKQETLLETHKKRIEQIDRKLHNPLMKSESASAIKPKPETPKLEKKNWRCSKCAIENDYWRIICHVCSTIKPYFDDFAPSPKTQEEPIPKNPAFERAKTQIGFSALASYNKKKVEKSISLEEKTEDGQARDDEREKLKKMLIEMKNSLPKRKSNILMKQNSRASIIVEDSKEETQEQKIAEIIIGTKTTLYENIKVKNVSKAPEQAPPKPNFELMRPKDFENIYSEGNGQSAARIYANLARNDELSLFFNVPKKLPSLELVDKNTDTIEVNRLLRKLENAISKGQLTDAASFAKELAQLKVNCSVVRQKQAEEKTEEGFSIEMYVEDKISHRGPFNLEVTAQTTVAELKQQVEREFEIPSNVQRWILGKELVTDDQSTLQDHNITTERCPVFLYLVAPEASKPGPSGLSNHAPKIIDVIPKPKIENKTANLAQEEDFDDYDTKTLKPEQWGCRVCTLLNPVKSTVCAVCTTARYREPTVAEPAPAKDQTYLQLVNLDNADLVTNVDKFDCIVCFLEIAPGDGVTLRECLHQFCKICLVHTVEYTEEAEVKCPFRDEQYSCNTALQDREIKALVTPQIYEGYLARSIKEAENKSGKSFHCKTPDCKGWCIFEDNVNYFRCPVCRQTNCLTCQAIHTGINCKQYQENIARNSAVDEDARQTKDMVEEMVKKGEALTCPTCQVILMKKWGCDWVRCSMCKTEICWVTKGPRWGPAGKGDTSGGCQCGVNGVKCHPQCSYCH